LATEVKVWDRLMDEIIKSCDAKIKISALRTYESINKRPVRLESVTANWVDMPIAKFLLGATPKDASILIG
jgi:hypothetical protein